MSDRELMKLAAKAYANDAVQESPFGFDRVIGYNEEMRCDVMVPWNPLNDDGDAMRLAVKLHIALDYYRYYLRTIHYPGGEWWVEGEGVISDEIEYGDYKPAAVRRAIVRAAAAIGEEM
jgi:hypothetical protein